MGKFCNWGEKVKRVLILVLVLGIVTLCLTEMGTLSYFTDVEQSRGNVFQAGTWETQADNLKIDTRTSFISGYKMHNVNVSNFGDGAITIVKLRISWTPDEGEKILKVWAIGQQPAKVWDGNETSGAILDITDCTLEPGQMNQFEFLFDAKMKDKEFTIQFQMEDGSLKSVIFTPSVRGDR